MKYLVFMFFLIMMMAAQAHAAQLMWDANADATAYQVFVREGPAGVWTELGEPVAGTVFDLPTMPVYNRDYEFAVQAVNECGNTSSYSEPVVFNPCAQAIVRAVRNLRFTVNITFNGDE